MQSDAVLSALNAACDVAEAFRGATSPNPPVGAAGLDASGKLLGVAAHEKAGGPHAEAALLTKLRALGLLERLHTVVVTLEPCNHTGKTPPCTGALLQVPSLKRVVYAVSDPNPRASGGAAALEAAGIEVTKLELERARELARPFCHWIRTGLPWVTVKTAWRKTADGTLTMIPEPGQKTFTSEASLKFAHELRKRSDAMITGSGTVLSDLPSFTVRHVRDHPGKARGIIVLDRRSRVLKDAADWIREREKDGFHVEIAADFPTILKDLGKEGVLEVLVEAGPALSQAILAGPNWDEHFRVFRSDVPSTGDRVEKELRNP